MSAQQQAALNSIMDDFEAEVSTSNSGSSDAWQSAVQQADNRYKLLFGDDAFNNLQVQSAREALTEQASVAQPKP